MGIIFVLVKYQPCWIACPADVWFVLFYLFVDSLEEKVPFLCLRYFKATGQNLKLYL